MAELGYGKYVIAVLFFGTLQQEVRLFWRIFGLKLCHQSPKLALRNSHDISLKCIKKMIVVNSKSVPFYFIHASAVTNSPETGDVGVFFNVVHLIIQS